MIIRKTMIMTIVLTGTEGPIVTTVKALLTPSKMQDLRVKCGYTEHKELMAAQGVRHAFFNLVHSKFEFKF